MYYFDSAATSFYRPYSVRVAVNDAIARLAGYGRSGHTSAAAAAERVYLCRKSVAELFGMSNPERVIFCNNATHALNIAIRGFSRKNGVGVISCFEHNAVSRPAYACGRVAVAEFDPYNEDSILSSFKGLLASGVSLCVCTMVSNAFGNILPVSEIGAMCKKRGVPFVVDASQAAGTLDIDVKKLNADAVCMPGHKALLGPTGTGILLLTSDMLPAPIMFGGTGSMSQSRDMPDVLPDRYEAGTLNVAGICGLLEGIRFVRQNREGIFKHEALLCKELRAMLTGIPRVKLYYGPEQMQCPGLLSFGVDGRPSEEIVQALADEGFALRGGLHCAPLAHKRMGTTENGTARVSFCYANTLYQTVRLAEAIEKLANQKNMI